MKRAEKYLGTEYGKAHDSWLHGWSPEWFNAASNVLAIPYYGLTNRDNPNGYIMERNINWAKKLQNARNE